MVSGVGPLMSYVKYAESISSLKKAIDKKEQLPFSNSFSLPSFLHMNNEGSPSDDFLPGLSCSSTMRQSIRCAAELEGGIDEVVVNALGSLTNSQTESLDDSGKPTNISGRINRSRGLALSHKEKSRRIFQHCSSWTQLDDTRANRGMVHGQGENIDRLFCVRLQRSFLSYQLCFSFRSGSCHPSLRGTIQVSHPENKCSCQSYYDAVQPNIGVVVSKT